VIHSQGRGREGMALLAVLVVGVAITLAAHAALMLGRSLRTSAAIEAHRVEVAARLESRLAAAVAGFVGHGDLSEAPPVGVVAHRHTPELLQLRVDSASHGHVALLWSPDPLLRLLDDSVGVRTGRAVDAGTRSRIGVAPPGTENACPTGLSPTGPLRDARPHPGWEDDAPLRIGPVDAPAVLSTLSELPPPPAGPTAALVAGPLRVEEAHWSGALWVAGDLEVGPGGHILGRVAVAGDLTIEAGARLEGTVRVGGSLRVLPGGVLTVDPCRSLLAMGGVAGTAVALHPLAPGGGTGGMWR